MKRVDIKTGYSCNNNCLFCVLGRKRESFPDRTTKEVFGLLKAARQEGFVKVVLTGGEVTLRKDIFVLIRYASSLGFSDIHIETNGVMLGDHAFTDRLISVGATSFSVSLHSDVPSVFAELTRTEPARFFRVVEGLRYLGVKTPRLAVNCTVNKMNVLRLGGIIDLCSDLGVRSFHMPFINICGNAREHEKRVGLELSEGAHHVREAIRRGKAQGMAVSTEMIPFCHLGEFSDCACEAWKDEMKVVALEYVESDFRTSQFSGRRKSVVCSQCRFDVSCPGIIDDSFTEKNLSGLVPVLAETSGGVASPQGRCPLG